MQSNIHIIKVAKKKNKTRKKPHQITPFRQWDRVGDREEMIKENIIISTLLTYILYTVV